MNDWEIVVKLVLAFVGIVSMGKVITDIFAGRKANLREEYKFAKEFISDIEAKELQRNKLHPFLIGKGYQAIAGTNSVKPSEIEFMLSLENPMQRLRDYIFSRRIFETLEVDEEFRLVYKKKYFKAYSRGWRKVWYFVLYVIFSALAISPWLASPYFSSNISHMFISLLFTLPTFGLYSFWSIRAAYRIKKAEELFNNQRSHTSKIVVI